STHRIRRRSSHWSDTPTPRSAYQAVRPMAPFGPPTPPGEGGTPVGAAHGGDGFGYESRGRRGGGAMRKCAWYISIEGAVCGTMETTSPGRADRTPGRCSGRWGLCFAAEPHRPRSFPTEVPVAGPE